jgi:integrase
MKLGVAFYSETHYVYIHSHPNIMSGPMALGKQAKVLNKAQADAVLGFLNTTRYPERNRLIFLLSIKAGLRAKEIASLRWEMLTDAEGDLSEVISLTDKASKGRSGRTIPINRDLRGALELMIKARDKETLSYRNSPFVITSERGERTSPASIVNMFRGWYYSLKFIGASSHSGRRTFITNAARRISTVGGSLRDVQILAGHSALSTTQRYIEADQAAQRRVVDLL